MVRNHGVQDTDRSDGTDQQQLRRVIHLGGSENEPTRELPIRQPSYFSNS
jgi:hypothetical protein